MEELICEDGSGAVNDYNLTETSNETRDLNSDPYDSVDKIDIGYRRSFLGHSINICYMESLDDGACNTFYSAVGAEVMSECNLPTSVRIRAIIGHSTSGPRRTVSPTPTRSSAAPRTAWRRRRRRLSHIQLKLLPLGQGYDNLEDQKEFYSKQLEHPHTSRTWQTVIRSYLSQIFMYFAEIGIIWKLLFRCYFRHPNQTDYTNNYLLNS